VPLFRFPVRTKLRCAKVLFVLPALMLGGCDGTNARGGSNSEPLLRRMARAVLVGEYSDRAAIAARDGDEAALEAANAGLQKFAPRIAAQRLIDQGLELYARADMSTDKKRAAALQEQAGQKYREALRIAPNFDSNDQDLLNAVGYYFAESGKSQQEFAAAERLTRRSLELWDEIIDNTDDRWLPNKSTLLAQQKFFRALTAHDSLAWALFRQKKHSEALEEQTAAVLEAETYAKPAGQKMSADLFYHLGEIYRALGKYEKAKAYYRKALQLEPTHALTLQALKQFSPVGTTKPPKQSRPQQPPRMMPSALVARRF
jgi:tetratricopeptide (TPR) repeat protein